MKITKAGTVDASLISGACFAEVSMEDANKRPGGKIDFYSDDDSVPEGAGCLLPFNELPIIN